MADEHDKLDEELELLMSQSTDEDDDGEGETLPKKKPVEDDDDEPSDDDDDGDDDGDPALDEELQSLLGAATPKRDEHRDESISRSRAAQQAGVIPQAGTDKEVDEVLQKISQGTDPVSRVLQGLIRHSYVTQKRLDDYTALQDVPTRIRSLVKAEYEKGDYRTVEAARRAVVGMLVSGELKAPGGKKRATARKQPRKELEETTVRDGGGRKPKVSVASLREMDEDLFYKAMDGPPSRLKQVLSQRWRNGDLKLTKKK